MKSLFFFVVSLSSVFCFAVEGFRIENDTRRGAAAPIRSTTLFDGTVFYSFIGANGEIIRFEPAKGVFTLLDPALRVQTHLAATETRQIVDAQRSVLPSSKNEFFAFAAKPVFTMEFDEAAGLLVLQSPWINYSLTTKLLDAETARLYFDFCDWSCHLSQRMNPGLLTPLIRLEVNRILREKNLFPESVKVSVFPQGKKFFAKETTFQTMHEFPRRLTDLDHRRIDKALESIRNFPVVPFNEYQAKVNEKIAAEKNNVKGKGQ